MTFLCHFNDINMTGFCYRRLKSSLMLFLSAFFYFQSTGVMAVELLTLLQGEV